MNWIKQCMNSSIKWVRVASNARRTRIISPTSRSSNTAQRRWACRARTSSSGWSWAQATCATSSRACASKRRRRLRCERWTLRHSIYSARTLWALICGLSSLVVHLSSLGTLHFVYHPITYTVILIIIISTVCVFNLSRRTGTCWKWRWARRGMTFCTSATSSRTSASRTATTASRTRYPRRSLLARRFIFLFYSLSFILGLSHFLFQLVLAYIVRIHVHDISWINWSFSSFWTSFRINCDLNSQWPAGLKRSLSLW